MIRNVINSVVEIKDKNKRKYARAIEEGLFLDERLFCSLANKLVYNLGIKALYKTARKLALERLVSLSSNEEHYLAEADNNCLVGYIFNDEGESWNNSNFVRSEGELISCRKELHTLDYWFRNSSSIKLFPNPNQIASFSIKDGIFYVDNHAFSQYINRVKESIPDEKVKKWKLDTKRGCLMSLFNKFKESIPVDRRNAALQIMKYDFERADYRATKDCVFVIVENNVLKTCYYKGNVFRAGYMPKR